MFSRSSRPKLYRRVCLSVVLAGILLPYVFSRLASPWRQVSVHKNVDELSDKVARSNDGKLCVATYNIAHGRGLATSNWQGGSVEDRLERLQAIAHLLRQLDADIVVLNEVDFDSSWSSSQNQARFLAKNSGYPYWAEQRNFDLRVLAWKWKFGNAILSKYPISQANIVDLPGYSTIETILAGKKRALNCTVDIEGDKVQVIGVHLCQRSEANRVSSASVIVDIASSSRATTLVAGDFNSTPTGLPNSEIDSVYGNAIDRFDESGLFQRKTLLPNGAPELFTFHSTQPESTIDWILASKNYRIAEYRIESSTLSDHRPVVAVLAKEDLINSAR